MLGKQGSVSKFKIGDTVKYIGAFHTIMNKEGIISDVYTNSLEVKIDGKTWTLYPSEVELVDADESICISMDKEYTTRNGYPVRIYSLDGTEPLVVHGAFFVQCKDDPDDKGEWFMNTWDIHGRETDSVFESDYDLIEKKEVYTRYMNVYANGDTQKFGVFSTRKEADKFNTTVGDNPMPRVARIKIDFTKGQYDK